MRRALPSLVLCALAAIPAWGGDMPEAIPGWSVTRAAADWETLARRVEDAAAQSPLGVVYKASPTAPAAGIGETIPGNMVIGLFAPEYAVRVVRASVAAQYEPPLELYVTENGDGSATLSYKLPSTIFSAYPDGGAALATVAAELDEILDGIASRATSP